MKKENKKNNNKQTTKKQTTKKQIRKQHSHLIMKVVINLKNKSREINSQFLFQEKSLKTDKNAVGNLQ